MCSIMRRVRHSEAMKRLLSFGAATAAFSLWAASCSFVTDFRGLGSATATGAGGGDGPVTSQTTSNSSSQSVGGSGGTSAGGIGGSGGEEQPCPPPGIDYGPLKINEVHARGIPDDWIELKNTGSTAIPLCAVFITQSYNGVSPPTGDDRYTFNEMETNANGVRFHFNENLDIDLEVCVLDASYEEQPLPELRAIYRQYLGLQSGPFIETVGA